MTTCKLVALLVMLVMPAFAWAAAGGLVCQEYKAYKAKRRATALARKLIKGG